MIAEPFGRQIRRKSLAPGAVKMQHADIHPPLQHIVHHFIHLALVQTMGEFGLFAVLLHHRNKAFHHMRKLCHGYRKRFGGGAGGLRVKMQAFHLA